MPTATVLEHGPSDTPHERPVVDVVVPVYNEAHVLEQSIETLHHYLSTRFPFSWRITVVDNASTDGTWEVARTLSDLLPGVRSRHLDEKGRGRALRAAWTQSDAEVVAYMDVDLSTDLDGLLPLVAPLVSGHSDLAIGSRLADGARVSRGPKREFISRTYNRLLRATFRNGFRDAQCGFKAVRAEVARALLPAVEDQGWFFDTELLLIAEHNGLRISEVPVDWVDDPDSRVDIVRTASGDLRGMARVAWRFWTGRGTIALGPLARPRPTGTGAEMLAFCAIGALSTVVHLGLFTLLWLPIGAVAANVVGLTVAMLVNTAAHRRYTFDYHGRSGRACQWRRATVVHLAGLILTTGALLVSAVEPEPSFVADLVALGLAALPATGLRFLLMPAWVFRNDAATPHLAPTR
jgi:putative flippase GtrA